MLHDQGQEEEKNKEESKRNRNPRKKRTGDVNLFAAIFNLEEILRLKLAKRDMASHPHPDHWQFLWTCDTDGTSVSFPFGKGKTRNRLPIGTDGRKQRPMINILELPPGVYYEGNVCGSEADISKCAGIGVDPGVEKSLVAANARVGTELTIKPGTYQEQSFARWHQRQAIKGKVSAFFLVACCLVGERMGPFEFHEGQMELMGLCVPVCFVCCLWMRLVHSEQEGARKTDRRTIPPLSRCL